jgi:hypothetical protein
MLTKLLVCWNWILSRLKWRRIQPHTVSRRNIFRDAIINEIHLWRRVHVNNGARTVSHGKFNAALRNKFIMKLGRFTAHCERHRLSWLRNDVAWMSYRSTDSVCLASMLIETLNYATWYITMAIPTKHVSDNCSFVWMCSRTIEMRLFVQHAISRSKSRCSKR